MAGRLRAHESNIQKVAIGAEKLEGFWSTGHLSSLPAFVCLQLRESVYDIRTFLELLGQRDVKATMIDTHAFSRVCIESSILQALCEGETKIS